MNAKTFPLVFMAWLIASIPSLAWYDLRAYEALLHISHDRAGNIVFQSGSTVIYPFTYAAALISLVGVAYYLVRSERRVLAVPVAILVARASTIGMMNLYEQVFTGVGSAIWQENVWLRYYGSDFITFMWGVSGMLWVITVAPWVRRANLVPVVLVMLGYVLGMVAWILTGYQPPDMNRTSYLLNTVTRLLPHIALVFAVRPAGISSK
ncbi:MAG: hypothetical protein QXD32_00925 [Nitrososphaerota archaeon]